MKITPCDDNKEKLIRLWMKVFGDEREYIGLLFPDNEILCDVFAITDGDSICAALYLLDCSLKFDGTIYKGKYLYAAATDEEHRNRGLMSALIREAQSYCKKDGFDFISLVPADEWLYNYYGKFGFISAMYRTTVFNSEDKFGARLKKEITGSEYFNKRSLRVDNCIMFDGESIKYAVSCLEYNGLKFYEDSDSQLFITENDSYLFDEYISENTAMRYIVDNETKTQKRVTERFGMLYPINTELERDWNFTDIYMNIALD